jgi:hypothetical protein
VGEKRGKKEENKVGHTQTYPVKKRYDPSINNLNIFFNV